jgi:hypothetical protein
MALQRCRSAAEHEVLVEDLRDAVDLAGNGPAAENARQLICRALDAVRRLEGPAPGAATAAPQPVALVVDVACPVIVQAVLSFTRVARTEGRSVYAVAVPRGADASMAAAAAAGACDDVIVRPGHGFEVPRLVERHFTASTRHAPHRLESGKTYVVVGGSGALGRLVIDYIRETAPGARIVALARNEPLTQLPDGVVFVAADAADRDSVERACAAADVGAVAGLFYTAGVVTDAMLENQTADSMTTAFAAKGLGATNVKEVLQPADFAVLFSSASAVFGPAGELRGGERGSGWAGRGVDARRHADAERAVGPVHGGGHGGGCPGGTGSGDGLRGHHGSHGCAGPRRAAARRDHRRGLRVPHCLGEVAPRCDQSQHEK